ncbi:uncharacterized protein VTP21DRAFT_3834 [Calcarisporiella thermophila]|uniref:uncharacterized protein n=1 Tax=Calcarisporiella thermophila TaxID=911321 RepID=UPI003742705A
MFSKVVSVPGVISLHFSIGSSNTDFPRMIRSIISRPAVRQVVARRQASSTPTIANIEARWRSLSSDEQRMVARQVEEIQKNDWTKLSLEEKKAAYWVAFGPHGPREPLEKGHGTKVFFGVVASLAVSTALFAWIRSKGQETPKTLSKEWQEATNEYMKGQKSNPISGISSEGYSGKGYVSS